jgi:hypothetical protein
MARLEIEHLQHGGLENGALVVTYDQLVEYGVYRHGIAPAVRELEELGFIEVMKRGCALNGQFNEPSVYRITYVRAKGSEGDGTHEWRKIKSIEEAEAVAQRARASFNPRARSLGRVRARKQNASDGFRRPPVQKTTTEGTASPVPKTGTPTPVPKTGTAYISRSGPHFLKQGTDGGATMLGHVDPPGQPGHEGLHGPFVNGSYRISGRTEPVVLFASPRSTTPLPRLLDGVFAGPPIAVSATLTGDSR